MRFLNCVKSLIFILLLLIGSSLVAAQAQPSATEPPTEVIRWGVFAFRGIEETTAMYAPIARYLDETLPNYRVTLHVLPMEKIYDGIERQALDFVTTNPTHFLVARRTYPLSGVIATLVPLDPEGNPVRYLAGVIATHAERTDINHLSDLRSKTVAAPSLNHMGGYRAQAYELALAGVRSDAYRIVETAVHQEAIRALLRREVDVAFVRNGIIETMLEDGEFEMAEIKLINPQTFAHFPMLSSTRLYPEWPVFALPHVAEHTMRHFTAALLSLESDHPAAIAAGIHGYTIPADYLPVEELARTLRLPPFENYGAITLQSLIEQFWLAGLGIVLVLATLVLLLVRGQLARRALRASQRQLDLFFSQSLHGFFVCMLDEPIAWNDADADKDKLLEYTLDHLRMTKANQAMLDQYGATEQEFIGISLRALFQHNLDHAKQVWYELFDKGRWQTETFEQKLDGTPMHIEGDYICLYDEQGRITGHFGVQVDVTEHKRAEQKLLTTNHELEQAMAQAESANRAKSQFLANMSHEIRTPMNGVIGMSNILLDTELSPEQRRYAEIVKSSGESLLTLINDILDFSKIEAGKLDLEILDFDLQTLLADFAATMAIKTHDKGLELICALDPDVPTQLAGDPGRLRQILTNLVGNAVKFTQQGEVAVRVSLHQNAANACQLRFAVRDTGIGIPADKIDLLFEQFTQVDASTTRQFGGTGLGLAISKQLATLMGGDIGVTSVAGQGSEFWFTARFDKRADREQSAPPAELGGVRTLIIDDNATNREILMIRLTAWGMRPEEAHDGATGLQALYRAVDEADPFRLAIVDMQMPGMDGEAVGRVVKVDAKLAATRLVMLTSLGMQSDSKRLQEVGFSGYATKPVNHQELKGVLAQVIASDQDSAPQPIATRDTVRPTLPDFTQHRFRILLAEDNIINQQVAVNILNKLGLTVDAVANGREAIQALKTMPYDLVLMDVQMPEMDGLEATKIIRSHDRQQQLPIIAMTAHAMQGDKDKCLEAGMDDYLTKPVDPQALARMLEQWLL